MGALFDNDATIIDNPGMERVYWDRQGGSRPFYINRFDVEGEFRYPPHDHADHWEFVYVVAGEFSHTINGRRRTHEAGRVILIRDADVHALRGRGFSYVNVAFPPHWVERYALFAGRADLRERLERAEAVPSVRVKDGDQAFLVSRFDALLRAPEGAEGRMAFTALLSLLLSELAPNVEEVPDGAADRAPSRDRASSAAATPPPRWLADLASWAAARECPPTPVELTRKSGYTAEHVIRSFRRFYDTTPASFLTDLRLRRAEDLLRFTNFPITRVADRSGWSGVRQFERRFRLRYGCAPRDYRAANAIHAH